MMDTMAAISNLLTEFNARKQIITNAAERSAFVKDIDCLERAWNSGNEGDARKHATNVQKFAKKYKTKFTNSFWQTIESISSGDSVPQKGISLTRPTSKYSRRGSEETATSKGSTTKQPVKAMAVLGIKYKAQQLQRLSEQVSYENRQYEKLEKEEDELLSRLSEQLSQEKKLFGKIDVEKDEFLNRLSQQLSEEKNKYEQLRNEKKEIHNRLLHQLSHEQKRYIALKTDRDEIHLRLSNQLSDEKSKFRALKTENDDMYQRMTDTQERLREMFQHVTGREYKGPSISDGKGKTKENQYNTVEELHQMISDMDKQLVDYTRTTDTQESLREMFQHVTGREYKGPSISDGKGNTKETQYNTVEELYQMISDIDKQLVDYTSQQDRIHHDSVTSKQDLDKFQKRLSDTDKRLKEMFQHVTGREYNGPSNKDGKGMKENQTDPVEVLQQLIYSMDKLFVDYTSDGMVSGRKAYNDDQQPSAGMVSGRKALVDQKHQSEIEGHIQLDLIRQRLKPICAEVLNVDTDDMDTLQMIECLGKCLKKQNVRTQLATPQDSVQQQLKLEREAWLKRIKDTEDKLKEMVEQVTQLKKAAVGSKFK